MTKQLPQLFGRSKVSVEEKLDSKLKAAKRNILSCIIIQLFDEIL